MYGVKFEYLKLKLFALLLMPYCYEITNPFSMFVLNSEFEAGYLDARDLTSRILSGGS